MTLHRGRISTKKQIGQVRELTRGDLELLRAPRPKSATVAVLRDSHHRVARLFAMGLRNFEVAARCGYSNSRLSRLLADPAFQNEIARYRNMVDESWKEEVDEFYAVASKNRDVAERMIADQLEEADESGEAIPLKVLNQIVADRADRTGYGKRNTVVNVNVDFANKLDRARARSAAVLDLKPNPSGPALEPPRQVDPANSHPPPGPVVENSFRRRGLG